MNLEGKWINEFGSTIELTVESDGFVSGSYKSHTGASGTYRVVGVTDTQPDTISQTVAFSISWRPIDKQLPDKSFHWCSGFVGQLQMIDGQEVLTTTYLLTQNTDPGINWMATSVDKAIFKRTDG